MAAFLTAEFLTESAMARLVSSRVTDPERSLRAAAARKRRSRLTLDGRLNLLAADHPARRVTAVGKDPLRMADRRDYLARILRVLMSPAVDGVMTTMDILEDLLTLHDLSREAGGPAFLDDKVLIASVNRGGLSQASWELDDPVTGPAPAACASFGLDGVKFLLRLCDAEPASLKTMLAAAQVISQASAVRLPAFLESLPVARTAQGYQLLKTPEALARIVGVASALGDSSRYLWLKLPYCDGFETVARATTLPILLLGGESEGDATPFLRQLAAGLAAGPNVRGALAGRNVLYPGVEDPLAVAEALGGIIHQIWTFDQALAAQAAHRGRDLDWLACLGRKE